MAKFFMHRSQAIFLNEKFCMKIKAKIKRKKSKSWLFIHESKKYTPESLENAVSEVVEFAIFSSPKRLESNECHNLMKN